MLRVWVDGWQVQCCGEAFAVGDVVRWTLLERPWEQELLDRSGRPEVVQVTHAEDHHVEAPHDAPRTEGHVRRIVAVSYEYAPLPGSNRTLTEVAGSGRAHERWRVDGWEHELERGEARGFAGYVVDLDVSTA